MKQLILFASFLAISSVSQAQYNAYYRFAAGVRAGSTGATCGGTLKAFVANSSAFEAILGYYQGGFSGTLLFEQHTELFGRKEFQLYYGGGGHYSNSSGYQTWILLDTRVRNYEQTNSSYGFDGVLGLEYKFLGAPIAVCIDFKPAIEFNTAGGYAMGLDQGVGIKLTF